MGTEQTQTTGTQPQEFCVIRVMFVVTNSADALAVREAIRTATANMPGVSIDFRIANNIGPMLRQG